jgi:hypothetical protein
VQQDCRKSPAAHQQQVLGLSVADVQQTFLLSLLLYLLLLFSLSLSSLLESTLEGVNPICGLFATVGNPPYIEVVHHNANHLIYAVHRFGRRWLVEAQTLDGRAYAILEEPRKVDLLDVIARTAGAKRAKGQSVTAED